MSDSATFELDCPSCQRQLEIQPGSLPCMCSMCERERTRRYSWREKPCVLQSMYPAAFFDHAAWALHCPGASLCVNVDGSTHPDTIFCQGLYANGVTIVDVIA